MHEYHTYHEDNDRMFQLTLFQRSSLDFLAGKKMVVQVLDLAPPADVLKSPIG